MNAIKSVIFYLIKFMKTKHTNVMPGSLQAFSQQLN